LWDSLRADLLRTQSGIKTTERRIFKGIHTKDSEKAGRREEIKRDWLKYLDDVNPEDREKKNRGELNAGADREVVVLATLDFKKTRQGDRG